MKYIFETRMEVRDYECDIEGIVNNANYLHYTEHTRHLFLRSLGVSFAKLHEQGIDAVIHSMKLQYKVPLRCDDEFISRLNLKKDGLKYMFYQDIYRASDEQLCFRASTAPATSNSVSAPPWNSSVSSTANSATVPNTTKPLKTIFDVNKRPA